MRFSLRSLCILVISITCVAALFHSAAPWRLERSFSGWTKAGGIFFCDKNNLVIALMVDGVSMLNFESGELKLLYQNESSCPIRYFCSDCDTLLFVGRRVNDHEIAEMYNVRSKKIEWQLVGETSVCDEAGFAPNGKLICLAGSGNFTGNIYDARTGTLLYELNKGFGNTDISSIKFAPSSTFVLVLTYGEIMSFLYDFESRKETLLSGGNLIFDNAVFSHDGNTIATWGETGVLCLWDIHTGRNILESTPLPYDSRELRHWGKITHLVFAPDGREVCATMRGVALGKGGVSDDNSVCIFDITSKKLRYKLNGHNGPVSDACYSLEGRRIVTAGVDGTIRIWNSEDGAGIYTINGTGAAFERVWVLDESRIVAACNDGNIQFWRRVRPEQWWGIFALPVFWGTAAAFVIFCIVVKRDIFSKGIKGTDVLTPRE